jgi:hypothetical protein
MQWHQRVTAGSTSCERAIVMVSLRVMNAQEYATERKKSDVHWVVVTVSHYPAGDCHSSGWSKAIYDRWYEWVSFALWFRGITRGRIFGKIWRNLMYTL